MAASLVLQLGLVVLASGNYLGESTNYCTHWCYQPYTSTNCSREIQCEVQEGYNARYTHKPTAPSPKNFHLSYECAKNTGQLGLVIEWDIKGSEIGETIENWKLTIEEQDGYSPLKTFKIGIFQGKQLPKEHMIHFKYFYVESEKYPLFITADVNYVVSLESIPFYSRNHQQKEQELKIYIPKKSCKQQSGEDLLTTTSLVNNEGAAIQKFNELIKTIIIFLIAFIILTMVTIFIKNLRKRSTRNRAKKNNELLKLMMIANLQNKEDVEFGHKFACKLKNDHQLIITSNWEGINDQRTEPTRSRTEWYHDEISQSSVTLIINPESEKGMEREGFLANREFLGALRMAKDYALTHKTKIVFLNTEINSFPYQKREKYFLNLSVTITKLSQILRIFGRKSLAKYNNKTIFEYVYEN